MKSLKGRKYLTLTWGCQMNERDTEVIQSMLEDLGLIETKTLKEADVVVLVTCCVREKAENKVYGRIGELVKIKKNKRDLLIVVYGCMVQQKGVSERLRKRFPEVDIVLGTHNIHRLPELLKIADGQAEAVVEVWDEEGDKIIENIAIRRKNYLKAKVIISHGCNNFCSYCIVPYVRGRERSRHPESILWEIEHLAANGCKEVLLLGQNVNSYGKDLGEGIDFPGLLEKVVEVDGIRRIRFMTSHPKDFSDRLIKTIAQNSNICKHIHLPVQAGSNRILKRMNRGYTREDYLQLVSKIKRNIPDVSITTDIIVGFPGETEEEFEQTLDLVRKAEFDNAYTFMYSPRKGTAAEKFEDHIPQEIKKVRLQKLMELQNEISLTKNKKLVGRMLEVLIDHEEKNEAGETIYSGRTDTNKIVTIKESNQGSLWGLFQNVEITAAQTWSLNGKIA